MAIRGVYTNEEKKMLAEFEKTADKMSGWYKEMRIHVASEDSIRNWALAMDPWNPLWLDDIYAKKTRWEGIIAPPMYQECITLVSWMLAVPPSVGYMDNSDGAPILTGEDWEFFKPIRPWDSFKIWRRRAKLEDVTSPDKEDLRRFNLFVHDLDLINQKDEIVNTFKCYLRININVERPKGMEPQPPYTYSEEELAFIDRTLKEEIIRGADTRYWEDVKVGDELQPVIIGPTTAWDMLVFTAARQDLDLLPMAEIRKRMPGMVMLDPDTGVTHHGMEMHITDHAAQLRGMPRGIHSGAVERQLMARLVSNWIGDDGFIRKFDWRYFSASYIGDTLISRGKVIGKRIENGEHLVDLSVEVENIKGHTGATSIVTVSLCARADL